MQFPDAARRAARTFVQAFTGVLALQAVGIMTDVSKGTWEPDLTWLNRVLLSALAAGVIALITWAHNWAEDNTNFPAIGKATPSSGANPVTSDPPK